MNVRSTERGAALVLVTVVLVVILVGGLAAIAVTSGELTGSRGYRTRQTTRACGNAALEKSRANMPDTNAAMSVEGGFALPAGSQLTYRTGHYDSADGSQSVIELDSGAFSGANVSSNAANRLDAGVAGSFGVRVMSITSTCEGPGHGGQETQIIFRYGVPTP